MGSSVFFDDAANAETAGFLANLYDDEIATVVRYTQARLLSAAQIKAPYRGLCSLHKRGKIVRTEGHGGGGFVWWMTHEQFIVTIGIG